MTRRRLGPDARAVHAMLSELLADLRRAGVEPTPLAIISAMTDRTRDDRMIRAVLAAAERRQVA
jgi:hypothetical protein